jgi:hypothetical protein
MRMKPSIGWCGSLLCVLLTLVSCDQVQQAQHVIASAEEAKREGELLKAADLYHQAEQLSP